MNKKFYKKISVVLMSGFVLSSVPSHTVMAERQIECTDTSGIENLITSIETDLNGQVAKEMIIQKFILVIDFICFDAEINGVKFHDLTTSSKAKVVSLVQSLDFKIETKFPGYKSLLGSIYQNAYANIQNEVYKVGPKVEEKIGKENYQNFKDGFDEFKYYVYEDYKYLKDKSKDFYEKEKPKVKKKYNDFKEKHKKHED